MNCQAPKCTIPHKKSADNVFEVMSSDTFLEIYRCRKYRSHVTVSCATVAYHDRFLCDLNVVQQFAGTQEP
eukprot:4109853-Amphidinium_carterae.2